MSVDALYAAMLKREAEAEALASDNGPDPLALWHCLGDMAAAVLAHVNGDPSLVAEYVLEASVASGDAFPLDSAESAALGVLLDAISSLTRTEKQTA